VRDSGGVWNGGVCKDDVGGEAPGGVAEEGDGSPGGDEDTGGGVRTFNVCT
jgi:hypothetical protein